MISSPPARVTVILNPASGRGTGRARRPELEQLLAQAADGENPHVRWDIVETTSPGSGAKQARRAAEAGASVVAAAGGDGTYGEVVNGLVGTPARLGILPLGTGNDFARTLGLAGDLPTAVDTLFRGCPKPIDLGRVGDRWFINVAGCGFDAVVAERVNRGYRRLHGAAAYVAAVCHSLLKYRPAHFHVTVDGAEYELEAMLCSIANSRTYGGGMIIAPDAAIDDGWFDLCILEKTGKIEFLRAFPRVFRGTHVTHPKVLMLRGRNIRVVCDPPMPVLVDGEVLGTTPADFTLHHHAIEVMAPRESLYGAR
jgi:diacylglycerol kinase (ATP)